MAQKRGLLLTLVLGALSLYLVLFLATRMPSLEDVLPDQEGGAKTFRRADFLVLLVCPEILLEGWFGSPPEFSLLDRLPVLATAGAILGVAAGLGWLLMRGLKTNLGLDRLETIVFSTAVGLSVISSYVLLIGLLGLLPYRAVFLLPALGVPAWAGRMLWKERSLATNRARHGSRRSPAPLPSAGRRPKETAPAFSLSYHWLWLASPFALVIVLGSMLPPVDFDVREYHLQVPKEFYEQGRVSFLPHNVYGNMAMGSEMLSLLAMVIDHDWWHGALAGKTVTGSFTILTALGLLAAGRRLFSPTAGILAALVYLSIPWIPYVSTAGLVEGAVACYLFLAVYAIILWQETRSSAGAALASPIRLLLLAGYLAGSAVSMKYPAALFVLMPLGIWVAVSTWRARSGPGSGKDRRSLFLPPLAFCLAAALACGLWFGKNWVVTGNPTYPLLYKIFGGTTWTPEKDAQWNRVHLPHEFSAGRLAQDLVCVGLTSEWLGPLVMPLAALALLTPKKRRLLAALFFYFAYLIAVWWLLTHRIDRFWIPVLPVIALLAGAGACWNTGRLWRTALLGCLVCASVVCFLMASSSGPGRSNRYFVSFNRLRDDPLQVDAWHRYFNSHPQDGRLLLVGDAEPFDLDAPLFYSTCFDDSLFEQLVKNHSPQEIRAGLASHRITRVFVHWGEITRYRRSAYGFSSFIQPVIFDRLVEQGILRPLPLIDGHPGRAYWVGSGE
jgi:hypothetical protein